MSILVLWEQSDLGLRTLLASLLTSVNNSSKYMQQMTLSNDTFRCIISRERLKTKASERYVILALYNIYSTRNEQSLRKQVFSM